MDFPPGPCSPGQCQELPVPADALALSQSCASSLGPLPCPLGPPQTLGQAPLSSGSSLPAPALFPPSDMLGDLLLCSQEGISPSRTAVTPQPPAWSLPGCPAWCHGWEPCAAHSRRRTSLCHPHSAGAGHCLLCQPPLLHLAFTPGNVSLAHQMLNSSLALEREPGVCPGFHFRALD